MADVASKALKENKSTVPRKKWLTAKIISMMEETMKLKNGSTLEYKLKYRD